MSVPTFLRPPFTLTYELNPPRSTDASKVLAHARLVAGHVDAFNVTDCPMSNLRMSPVPVAHRVQTELKRPTIPHITGRDRNLLGLQSELLGLAYLGIENVFALTGDPLKIGDHPHIKGVYELYANQLIELVNRLNNGHDSVGQKVEPPSRFSIGGAVTLTDTRPDGPKTFQMKLDAGVDFFQTQIILDARTLDGDAARHYQTEKPVLIGTTPLKNAKMLDVFKQIPGVDVTPRVEKRLKEAKNFGEEANRLVLELRDAVKGRYAGLHVMPVNPDETQVLELLGELRGRRAAQVKNP